VPRAVSACAAISDTPENSASTVLQHFSSYELSENSDQTSTVRTYASQFSFGKKWLQDVFIGV
jgi:hypothetical protein